jgi:adenylate kinase
METKTFVFMGRPGSGKGTQAKLLADALKFDYFATGKILRAMSATDTIIGKKVAETIDNGNLMPHWFASHLVVSKLIETAPNVGIVFDGSNRTMEEAELFFEVTAWIGRIYRVIYLDVPEESIVARINARHSAEGRADDVASAIKNRIHEYDLYTAGALAFHRTQGKVLEINGERPVEEVAADIRAKVEGI